jgi:hypothetical protein
MIQKREEREKALKWLFGKRLWEVAREMESEGWKTLDGLAYLEGSNSYRAESREP